MQLLQKHRGMGKADRLYKRRSHDKKSKATKRSGLHAPDAFLNQQFAPVTDISVTGKDNVSQIEDAFKDSLQNLGQLYQFTTKIDQRLIYPENIAAAFEQAEDMLSKKAPSLHLVITATDNSPVTLATVREFDTDMTLFYIPMDVLVRLHQRKNKAVFSLLLSSYAYLHQHAGMPLCDAYSYVDDCYRMNEEGMEDRQDDYDEDELAGYKGTFSYMKRCMKILNREIKNFEHLEQFGNNLSAFEPASVQERELHDGATQLFTLFQAYPGRSFRRQTSGDILYGDVEEKGYVDQYFSFCWTTDGWLIDQLVEYANCDLQEREALDQPVTIQYFDEPQQNELHDFTFENALIEAVNSLIYALNQLP